MSNECCCGGGRCGPLALVVLNRRDFMEKLALGSAALALLGESAAAVEEKATPSVVAPNLAAHQPYPLTPPRVYQGKNLQAVAMPLGGIGTGSLWLDGQGRLGVWQIFNNLSEPRIPDSFFAVRARAGKGAVVTRVLQTTERELATADRVVDLRRRLSDRPTDVPRCGIASRSAAGSAEPADSARRSQFFDSLRPVSPDRPQPWRDESRSGLHRVAAKRGGQRRSWWHSRSSLWRVRTKPKSRSPRRRFDHRRNGEVGRPTGLRTGEDSLGRGRRSRRVRNPLADGSFQSGRRNIATVGADYRGGRSLAGRWSDKRLPGNCRHVSVAAARFLGHRHGLRRFRGEDV